MGGGASAAGVVLLASVIAVVAIAEAVVSLTTRRLSSTIAPSHPGLAQRNVELEPIGNVHVHLYWAVAA